MSAPSPVMRLMRLMTHLNIGAMLGMAAWLVWSGWQVASGQVLIPRVDRPVHVEPEPMRLVPVGQQARVAGHCLPPADTSGLRATEAPVSGADL